MGKNPDLEKNGFIASEYKEDLYKGKQGNRAIR
jgi:hypothetical protein